MSMPPQLSTVPAQRRPEQSEADLVRAAQAGDREAFGLIYRSCYDHVLRHVRWRVGDLQVTEDITQGVFTRALNRIGTWHDQGKPIMAWLITIANNMIVDHFKAASTRLSRAVDPYEFGDTRAPSTYALVIPIAELVEETIAEESMRRHAQGVLERALDRLAPDQKLCVILRYSQGLSIDETAREMERNPGAIKALTYRAMQNLARDAELRALAVEIGI